LVAQQYSNDTLSQVQPSFFGYFIVMTVAATLSIVFQLKQREANVELYSYRKYDFKYRRAD